jgi:hypothetical protein
MTQLCKRRPGAVVVRAFAAMMIDRRGHVLLDEWVAAAQTSGPGPLAAFARGLADDYLAVRNRLSLPHSSGAMERNVNRKCSNAKCPAAPTSTCYTGKRVLLA